jgi:membrane-associated phospholipid phosphatase
MILSSKTCSHPLLLTLFLIVAWVYSVVAKAENEEIQTCVEEIKVAECSQSLYSTTKDWASGSIADSTQQSASSTNSKDSATEFIVWTDLKSSWGDMKELWSSLSTSSSKSLLNAGYYAGAMAIGIAAGMQADEQIRSMALRNQSTIGTKLFDIPNRYGELYSMAGLGGGLYLGGWIFGSDETRRTGRLVFESLLLSGTITTGLKYVFGRARPFMNEGAFSYQPLGEWDDARFAFPSGHTTAAFAMSTVLAMRVRNIYASIGLYTLAISTGVARMYYDKHWLTDTMFGGIIGTLSAIAVVNASDRVTKREEGCSCENMYSLNDNTNSKGADDTQYNMDDCSNPELHSKSLTKWTIVPTLNGVVFSITW